MAVLKDVKMSDSADATTTDAVMKSKAEPPSEAAEAEKEQRRQGGKSKTARESKGRRRRYVVSKDSFNPSLAPCSPASDGAGTVSISFDDRVDVICTTGLCSQKYKGNCDYLELVNSGAKALFEGGKCQDSVAINQEATRVVKAVRGNAGKFLKRGPTDTVWKDIGDVLAVTKTTRLLRLSFKRLNSGRGADSNNGGAPNDQDIGGKTRQKLMRELTVEERVKIELLPSPQREQVLKLTELKPWDVRAAVQVISIPEFPTAGALGVSVDTIQKEILAKVKRDAANQEPCAPAASRPAEVPSIESKKLTGTLHKRGSCPPRMLEANAANLAQVLLQAPKGVVPDNASASLQELLLLPSNRSAVEPARRRAPRRSCPPGFLSPQPAKRGKSHNDIPTPLLASIAASSRSLSTLSNIAITPFALLEDPLPLLQKSASQDKLPTAVTPGAPPKSLLDMLATHPNNRHPGQALLLEKKQEFSLEVTSISSKLNISPESDNSSMRGNGYHGGMLLEPELGIDGVRDIVMRDCQHEGSPQQKPLLATTEATDELYEPRDPNVVAEEKELAELEALSGFLSDTDWTC